MSLWKALLCVLCVTVVRIGAQDTIADQIKANANSSGIDLSSIPITDQALADIVSLYAIASVTDLSKRPPPPPPPPQSSSGRIDTHCHVVPPWYKSIVPNTGQSPTPDWSLDLHEQFMQNMSITHCVLSFSTPSANAFLGSSAATIALARILNEFLAALVASAPHKFSFWASVPLPYTDNAITEAHYAINNLGAVGLGVLTNHAGLYLGHATFTPFWAALNGMGGTINVFVHPADPVMLIDGSWVLVNPTETPSGLMEFYQETARTVLSLAQSQIFQSYPLLNWILSHAGGSLASCIDRALMSLGPGGYNSTLDVLRTRVWYDTAGPTAYHQLSFLFAFGMSFLHLMYGSDFPYAPLLNQLPNLQAIGTALPTLDQTPIFFSNAQNLLGSRLAL